MAYDELSQILTVSECNSLIKNLLEEGFYQVVVKGEISGNYFRPNSSGHYYFDLKDSDCTLPSAVFRSNTRGLEKFKVGDLVVATGHISFYEKGGKLSFIITRMEKEGDGELLALIEKRKAYYQSIGWFDEQNKPQIPSSIKKIGVITSATGAVIHDILDVTKRRAPSLDVILLPSAVQGKGAEITIASRIRQANNFSLCDVLIVARGGGSREDLMPYNENEVIEAIHESKIPVISAVGHESDWSLSDYAATLRAGTPSIAAEIVTKDIFLRRESFTGVRNTMNLLMEKKIAEAESLLPDPLLLLSLMKNRLSSLRGRLPASGDMKYLLENRIDNALMRLSYEEDALKSSMEKKISETKRRIELFRTQYASDIPRIIERGRGIIREFRNTTGIIVSNSREVYSEKVKSLRKELELLNPLSVLERGYAIVRDEKGRIITTVSSLKDGDMLNIRVKDGTIEAAVKEKI